MRPTFNTFFASTLVTSLLMISCINSDFVSVSEPDESNQNDEYLIFGTFYGFFTENLDDAIDTYKLTSDALYIDTNNSWDINKAQFTQLSNEKFNLVKNLINAVPSELIILNDSTFGCPNCADQGGVNVRYHKNGVEKRWVMDQHNDYNPEFLRDFKNEINKKIQLLNSNNYETSTTE